MKHDTLKDILEETDATLGRTEPTMSDAAPQILAEAARRKKRLTQRWTAAALAPVAASVLICLWIGLHPQDDKPHIAETPVQPDATPNEVIDPTIATAEDEIAELERQLANLEQELDRLRHKYRPPLPSAPSSRDMLLAELNEQRERTAGIVVCAADLRRTHFGLPESAKEGYEFVKETYPESAWAEIANERLLALHEVEQE
jgi:hypothetical protein